MPSSLPDGRTIVFSAALSGNTPELFTVSPRLPEPRSLGAPGDATPVRCRRKGSWPFSPASGISITGCSKALLARVPMSGGAPGRSGRRARGRLDLGRRGSGDRQIRRGTRPARDVLWAPCSRGGAVFSDVRVAHDGRHIAFFEHPLRYDDRGVLVVIDRKGGTTLRSPAFTRLEGLAWSADDRELVFGGVRINTSSRSSGPRSPARFARRCRPPAI